MPAESDALKQSLSRESEITISVVGRKTGQTISMPIWFVLEGAKLYLLPVQGSDTQWYKNLLTKASLQIDAAGVKAEFKPVAITDPEQVSSVVDKFRGKYGAANVKKYYSKFDLALLIQIP
jgi:hypothetical protein